MNRDKKAYSMPFMYIDQPEFQAIEVTMQSNFHSTVQAAPNPPDEQVTEERTTLEKNQKLTDSSIQHQINYFLYVPGEMPPLRCEVQTEDKVLQGIMVEEQATAIILRVFNEGYESIPKDSITNIRLIGF